MHVYSGTSYTDMSVCTHPPIKTGGVGVGGVSVGGGSVGGVGVGGVSVGSVSVEGVGVGGVSVGGVSVGGVGVEGVSVGGVGVGGKCSCLHHRDSPVGVGGILNFLICLLHQHFSVVGTYTDMSV